MYFQPLLHSPGIAGERRERQRLAQTEAVTSGAPPLKNGRKGRKSQYSITEGEYLVRKDYLLLLERVRRAIARELMRREPAQGY
jgi:hypothetical protein